MKTYRFDELSPDAQAYAKRRFSFAGDCDGYRYSLNAWGDPRTRKRERSTDDEVTEVLRESR